MRSKLSVYREFVRPIPSQDIPRRGERFSLSLEERAGVRTVVPIIYRICRPDRA
jgi:hypothetical protein